ncbi:MAG: sugar ABC transporter permease [Clostridia bacterium]|nr:sugar ABC transporter permease [Clostridia bacterium]
MKFFKDLKKSAPLLIMMLPVVVYYLLFNYLPMFGTLIAFKNFNYVDGFFKSPWVGLKNFEFLFQSADAFIITRNTLLYNLVFIFLGMFLSICLAITYDLLGRSKLNRVNQTLAMFPHFISWVIATYFVTALLDIDKGVLNRIITTFGGEPIEWYSESTYWPIIIVVCYIWKTIGYNSIIYYSNIKGFDIEYYEAARIDGASWFQQIIYITFPLLKSIAIIMGILAIGSAFYSDFGLFYLVPKNSGALYNVTSTIDTYVYNGLRQGGNLGMTTATGLYQSLVGFALVITTNAIVRKVSPENALF